MARQKRPPHSMIHGGKHRIRYWAWYCLCWLLPTPVIVRILRKMK